MALVASALDPRTKSLPFLGSIDTELIYSFIKQQIIEFHPVLDYEAPIVHVAPVAVEVIDRDDDDINDIFRILVAPPAIIGDIPEEDIVTADQLLVVRNHTIDAEIARFRAELAMKKILADGKETFVDPLDWWKRRSVEFPYIAKLARKVVCIPATSAPSERVFSAANL